MGQLEPTGYMFQKIEFQGLKWPITLPCTTPQNTERYRAIRACAPASVADEVFCPVRVVEDSVNQQLNHQFIVADGIDDFYR